MSDRQLPAGAPTHRGRMPHRVNGRVRAVALSLAFCLTTTVGWGLGMLDAAAAQTCAVSSPGGGAYTVEVCLVTPDGPVRGDVPISATVSVSVGGPGVSRMTFLLDGADLLVDYEPPYSFVLPSATFGDGTKELRVSAQLRDGVTSGATSTSLMFDNGNVAPPPLPTGFVPRTGTAPPTGEPFVLAATGDGASGQTSSDAVAEAVAAMGPNMFMYTGDVYDDGTYTEFKNWYGEGTRFGKLGSITNPILGNHEQDGTRWDGYDRYWRSPPPFYSYDAAGWHFVVFNSDSRYLQFTPGTPQYDWLATDLASHNSACTVAGFHHPVVSVGPQGDNPELDGVWQLLVDSGVDLALTGHDHSYQRWLPLGRDLQPSQNGTTQFVLGGGGHGIQGFVRTDPRMAVGADQVSNAYGALRLELNAKGAQYEYRNISGSVLDSGTLQCSGTSTDVSAPSAPTTSAAEAVHGGRVDVTWNASRDDVGVDHYVVRRNGATVGTVPGHQRSFTDTTVRGATTYTYTVEAVDAAGNASGQSPSASVTTPGSSGTLTFTAHADTYVNATAPGTNYGAATVLRLDASPDLRSYLRFDLSGITGTVTSAKLRVFSNSSHSVGYEVRSAPPTWDEGRLTYDNAPAPEELLTTTGGLAGGTYKEIDLTGKVPPSGVLSLALTPINGTAISLASRETASPAQLVVEQTLNDNRPPVADDLTLSAVEDQQATWQPGASEPDGDAVTCTIGSAPSRGTATVAEDCSGGTYVPRPDSWGSDSFSYEVSDGTTSVVGLVTTTVEPVNDAPVVTTQPLTLSGGTTRTAHITATDADGDCPLELRVVTPPTKGTLGAFENTVCDSGVVHSDIAMTAGRDAVGVDSFRVVAVDPNGSESAPGTVDVTVTPRETNFTLRPVADAYVDAKAAGSNFGTASQLRVDLSPLTRSYVKFEVPELTGRVISAQLTVYSGVKDKTGYRFHVTDPGWTELGLTHATAPAAGVTLGASGALTNNGASQVDVTAVVTRQGDVAFALVPLADVTLKLWARESTRPPVLTIRTD